MYRSNLFVDRQYGGFGTGKTTNERYKYLLEQGVREISVAMDLPTQLGYDSDNPLCSGEVGKVGVTISSLLDLEEISTAYPCRTYRSRRPRTHRPDIPGMDAGSRGKERRPKENLDLNLQNDV